MLAEAALSTRDRVDAICSLLSDADRMVARAVRLLMRDGIEAATGLSPAMMLSHDARRTAGDAHTLMRAAAVLSRMPRLMELFESGRVSWGQVRGICYALKRVPGGARERLDEVIAAQVGVGGDADRLVAFVEEQVDCLRPDLKLAREERAERRGFVSIQPRLDGRSSLYAEGDATAVATIAEAIEAAAPRVTRDSDGGMRGAECFEALTYVCGAYLAGATGGVSRPRLLATMQLSALESSGATLLWPVAGRSPRLSPVSRDMLACDASVIPIVFDGKRPVAVGEEYKTFSDKVRTAIVARDHRCRMCNQIPAGWSHIHHITPGRRGHAAEDGLLLCKQCHRRVHSHAWTITWQAGGSVEFRRGTRRIHSPPP